MAKDVKLDHALEFTIVEDNVLDAWLTAENAGLDDLAARILHAGLLLEHYTSLLDDDPGKRSSEEKDQQLALRADFEALLRELAGHVKKE